MKKQGIAVLLFLTLAVLLITTGGLAALAGGSANVYLPIIMKQRTLTGNVEGTVVNAADASPIADAQVCVLSTNQCDLTDTSGVYTLTAVPVGSQTLRATATDFVPLDQPVMVIKDQTVTLNFALTQALASGEIRIVLTWGQTPTDLDSHLWLPAATPYHVKWTDRGDCTAFPFACLDVDDVTSFGPETMTIKQRSPGTYVYAVYNWSNDAPLTASNARVQVYDNTGLIQDFPVPTSGSGIWWHVFDMDGTSGAITPVNTLSDTSPGPYDASPFRPGQSASK